MVIVGSVFEVQQEVGTNTIDPPCGDLVVMGRLVLENDASGVDEVRVQLGTGRNGVVAGLETRDGDDQIERHMPRNGVLLRRRDRDVGTGYELQNFSEFEASVGNHLCVFLLISSKGLDPFLSGGTRGVLDKGSKELSTGNGHHIDVVSANGELSGRNRERNLGESGIERLDVDDSVLIIETESAQQTVNLNIRIARPDADVITVLVVYTGTFDVEFHVNAVSPCVDVEELASDGDGSRERVLGVVDTL